MALIAAANQTGGLTQIQATTRPLLLQNFLEATGWGQTGTTTAVGAGDSSTLVDTTSLKSTQFPTKRWVGGFIRLPRGPAGSTTTEFRPITGYAPSTGTITVNPVFSGIVQSGVDYEIWNTPIAPVIILRLLDDLLQKESWFPCQTFPTIVPDGDMEQTGTTAYAAVNATLSKTLWALNGGAGVYGTAGLNVHTTSANGYGTMADNIQVSPGSTPWFAITGSPVTPASGTTNTLFVQVRDITNSTNLWSVSSAASVPQRFAQQINIPATCQFINIRFGSQENNRDTLWDELQVLDLQATDLPLPWWINELDQVKSIHEWEPGQSLSQSQGVYSPEFHGRESYEFDFNYTRFGAGQPAISRREGSIARSHWIYGVRNETAFSSDTEVKRVNEKFIVAGLAANVYDALIQLTAKSDRAVIAEGAARWRAAFEQQKAKRPIRKEKLRAARAGWRMVG